MITTEGQTSTGQEPRPVPTSKPRLLIVSDSSENLTRLRAALNVGDVEITSAASLEEVSRACRSPHDLAVIDLGPEQLVEALGRLREGKGCAGISVLVEAGRVAPEPRIAGVLPQYRAMPCYDGDLVTLARRRIAPTVSNRKAKRIL